MRRVINLAIVGCLLLFRLPFSDGDGVHAAEVNLSFGLGLRGLCEGTLRAGIESAAGTRIAAR